MDDALAARDEADAEEVSRDLDELLRDGRAHLDNRQSTFIETIREEDADDADQREAMLRAFIRAMEGAEIQVDGRVSSLVAEDELSEAEQREVRAYLDGRRQIRAAASRVVFAVAAGQDPDRADLNQLVGEEAAGWCCNLAPPRPNCEAVRGHLAELSGPNMPTQDFGAVFRTRQRFAEGSCAGTVMLRAIRECLVGAGSTTEMEACPRAIHRGARSHSASRTAVSSPMATR